MRQSVFEGVAAGKTSEALLFTRQTMVKQAPRRESAVFAASLWKQADHFRPMREACVAASISPAVSFHILRHTHASRLAGKGVAMAVIVAQLGHADTRMTERHYAHLARLIHRMAAIRWRM